MADYKTTEETRELLGLDVMRAEVDVLLRSTNDQVIAKADEARESATTAENARDEATTQASVSNDHRMAAEQARDSAVLASEAAGVTKFYDTNAAAEAAKAGLAEGQVVAIFADETRGGSPARYRKEGASLVFKLDLGQFDRLMELDLRKPRSLWAKIFAIYKGVDRINWVSAGDSLASRKLVQIVSSLDRMVGGSDRSTGNPAGSSAGGAAGGEMATTDAVSTTFVTGDHAKVPNGSYASVAAGGSFRYISGGVNPYFTRLRVFYVKEPGAGTITLTVDGTVRASASAASATVELGVLEYNPGGAAAQRQVVVSASGATVKVMGGRRDSEDARGVALFGLLAAGGITPGQLTQTADTRRIHQQLLAQFDADIITLEMDDNFGDAGVNAAALDTMLDIWTAAAPYTDKLLIGSTPRASGDSGKRLANIHLRETAQSRGPAFLYFDSYSIMGSYADMVQIFGSDDGVHPNVAAQAFAAEQLWNHLGLSSMNLGYAYRPVNAPNAPSTFFRSMKMKGSVYDLDIDADTGGYEWKMVPGRALRVETRDGRILARFSEQTAISTHVLPPGAELGHNSGRKYEYNDSIYGNELRFIDTSPNNPKGYSDLRQQRFIGTAWAKADLPPANTKPGAMLYCSNGRADGGGCWLYSDGGGYWKRMSDDVIV